MRRAVSNSAGTSRSRISHRSRYGASISVRPSRWSTSKRYSFSGISSAADSMPCTRRKRRMRSWNGSGLPSRSTATTSPSSRNSDAGNPFAIVTISGRLDVTSLSRRLKIFTTSPFRWIWIREPSSLYSIAVMPPCTASTSSRSSAISASIGFIGARRRKPRERNPSAPSKSAISPIIPRSPRNMWAVRTVSRSTPDASAIPSSITPSFTPIRISPNTFFKTTSRSPSDARPRRDSKRRRRPLVESGPWASAISANVRETSKMLKDRGTRLACFVPPRALWSVAHPTFRARASDSAKMRPTIRWTAGATSSLRRDRKMPRGARASGAVSSWPRAAASAPRVGQRTYRPRSSASRRIRTIRQSGFQGFAASLRLRRPAENVERDEGADHEGAAEHLDRAQGLRREHVKGNEDPPQGGGREDGSRPHRSDGPKCIEEKDGEDSHRAEREEDQRWKDIERDRERGASDGDDPGEHRGADQELDLQEGHDRDSTEEDGTHRVARTPACRGGDQHDVAGEELEETYVPESELRRHEKCTNCDARQGDVLTPSGPFPEEGVGEEHREERFAVRQQH